MLKKLYSAITGEQFPNFYKDMEKNIAVFKPFYLRNTRNYIASPNTNDAVILNKFYGQFPNGIEGTLRYCIEQIEKYNS